MLTEYTRGIVFWAGLETHIITHFLLKINVVLGLSIPYREEDSSILIMLFHHFSQRFPTFFFFILLLSFYFADNAVTAG